jgi:hypothetical protein
MVCSSLDSITVAGADFQRDLSVQQVTSSVKPNCIAIGFLLAAMV